MTAQTEFLPPKRKGTIFYLGLTLLLLGISGFLLIFALDQQSSGFFILALLGAILMLVPLPFILYSLYSLLRAKYALDREGLRIRWGLRSLDISMPEIDWVRMVPIDQKKLPQPAWGFTGLLRGKVRSSEFGEVEFLASDPNRLVLVGTSQKVYAISPVDPPNFLKTFQTALELGSITPLKSNSVQVSTFFSSLFKDRLARTFVLLDLALLVALLVTTAMLISSREAVVFGYQGMANSQSEPAPSDRLLLFPALNFISLVAVFTSGFFFFRNAKTRQLSYITLASGVITPLLFFLALLFIG